VSRDRRTFSAAHFILPSVMLTVDGDTVARLGGDEFVVITRRAPQQLSDSLTAAFAAPAIIAGYVWPVEVSVGICRLPGGDPH